MVAIRATDQELRVSLFYNKKLDKFQISSHLLCGKTEIPLNVEKFQISIHGISPHEEEFQFFHTTSDVEKCEILPNLEKFHISTQDRYEEI